MTKRRSQSTSGYTLLEVLIALALLSVLVAIIGGLMSVFARAEATAQRTAVDLRTLRSVRRQLTYDLERLVIAVGTAAEAADSPASDAEEVLGEGTDSASSRSGSSRLRSRLEQDAASSNESDWNDSGSRELTALESTDAMASPADRSTSEASFVGTPLGFRCRVMLSSDPAVWLQSLVEPPGMDANADDDLLAGLQGTTSGNRSTRGITRASQQDRSSMNPIDPRAALSQTQEASIASLLAGRLSEIPVSTLGELEYRLAADREYPGMGRRLQRRLTTRPVTIASVSIGDPNAVLGTDALYREDLGRAVDSLGSETSSSEIGRDDESSAAVELDFQGSSVSPPSGHAEPMVAERLRNASFRYSDGVNWYRAWEASKRGGLPVAIELTFDLDRSDRESATEGSGNRNATNSQAMQDESNDSLRSLETSAGDFEEDEELDPLAREQESLELTNEPDREVTPRETEVRWVIGIVGAEPTGSASDTEGGSPISPSGNGASRGGTRDARGNR